MVTHQLQVERRTGKVRRLETDVLPLCHAANHCQASTLAKCGSFCAGGSRAIEVLYVDRSTSLVMAACLCVVAASSLFLVILRSYKAFSACRKYARCSDPSRPVNPVNVLYFCSCPVLSCISFAVLYFPVFLFITVLGCVYSFTLEVQCVFSIKSCLHQLVLSTVAECGMLRNT